MIKNTHPGLFIDFEGLDGSGSVVQAELLYGVLSKQGYRTILTKEPTNSLVGGLIRGALSKEWKVDSDSLQLLFASDRAQHLNNEIIPNLEAGKIIISDRYAFSSIAYGSLDSDPKWIEKVNDKFIIPDLTFLIKVDPKICARRMKESHYGLELYRQEKNLAKVWRSYLKISKKYKNVYIIDGEQKEHEIIENILKIVKKRLGVDKK